MSVELAVLNLRGVFATSQEASRRPNRALVIEAAIFELRVKANVEAVALLIEAVGASEDHPVARVIHARFDGVFAIVPRDDAAWTRARDTMAWMRSPEFDAEVARWRELALILSEYAEELVLDLE